MKQNCSVKDMLAGGMSAEELLDSLREEIEKAQAEITAENKVKENTLAMTRETLAAALLDYLVALDIMPAEMLTEVEVEDLVEVIKMTEDQIKAYASIASLAAGLGIEPKPASRGKRADVCKCKEMTPADEEIIREFLKSLK